MMTLRIDGMDKIARNLRAMAAALHGETLVPVITEELEPMADQMRSLAARDTGQMAESVTITVADAASARNSVEVNVGPGPLPQVIQTEFGNYRQSPRPFIRPAFDANANQAVQRISARGVDIILRAAKD